MNRFPLVFSLLACLALSALAAEVPRPAPEISIALPDGKQAKASDYKGKVVVATFFLTTCPHCQKVIQTLNGVQRDLGPKGLQVMAGAMNAAEGASIPQFIQKFQPVYPLGAVDQISAGAYMQLSPMVRTFVPYMLIIDRKGVIRAQYTGGDPFLQDEAAQDRNIREEVSKLLDEKAPGKSHTVARKNK